MSNTWTEPHMITTPAAPDFSGPASADAYLAHHPGPVLVKGEPYSPPQPTTRTVPDRVRTAMANEAEGITCHDAYPVLAFWCTLPAGHGGPDHEDDIRDMPNTVAWARAD